ncbi:hypothetical protein BD289DRAFT_359294 [Coniella lustricola]|uniref:RRM domain-containing protein n=1 Tax=Coniella lustricola TaxID=2025994 RepID=A0A2T3ALQ0_9PEZI|nr:hypothetical protein BD289DRAFT_359294 [Coniella lustricola]
MRRRGTVNSDSFTPSSYLNSPLSNLASSQTSSPFSGASGLPIRTEPRNFAPRSGRHITKDPPPRFGLKGLLENSSSDISTNGESLPHSQSCGNFFAPTVGSHSSVPVSDAMVLHSDIGVPEYIRNLRSKELNELTGGPRGLPSADIALNLDHFPFIEGARGAQPSPVHGVVKLKSIPLGTKRSEIVAMLGRNSKILNDNQEPIHIIMERVTSKTGCAYVEFLSTEAALNVVERHQKNALNGRLTRLGDRPVDVELSSQAALMRDLFPLAKGVYWDGPRPIIIEAHPSQPWQSFKGFITEEEMTMLVKYVEIPQRSPFTRDCPQRPYEAIISVLRKFPWYMTECITTKQRHAVYSACVALLRHLQFTMRDRKDEGFLNQQLYRRLWTSAMLCHGFTVTMKDSIAFIVDLNEQQMREFNMPRFGNMWIHTYTMVPKPGAPLDVIEWYIAVIREESSRTVDQSLPNIQAEIHRESQHTSLYWGYFFKELDRPYGPAFDNMTLADMANREFAAVATILRRALPM